MSNIYVVDTNAMLRYLLNDDKKQSMLVKQHFSSLDNQFIVPVQVLCEVIWVLKNSFKVKRDEIIMMLERILNRENMQFNINEVQMGLEFLCLGGDFADGVIAYQANQYKNASLLTFDKKAQSIAKKLSIVCIEP